MNTKKKIEEIFFDTGLHIGDGIGDICSGYDEEAMEEAKQKISTLIQESNRESVRDAYRKGYFDSGVQPTSSEVIKFEKSYMEYLKSLDEKGTK